MRPFTQCPSARRRGALLIWFAVLVPVLVAWVGLTIDTGLLLETKRQTQNAADAAALAAAMGSDGLRIHLRVATSRFNCPHGIREHPAVIVVPGI